jgi:hypothetical protein
MPARHGWPACIRASIFDVSRVTMPCNPSGHVSTAPSAALLAWPPRLAK